jgi:mannosyltransferase OCH1-like enzyme
MSNAAWAALLVSTIILACASIICRPLFFTYHGTQLVSRDEFGSVSKVIHQTWDTVETIPTCCHHVINRNKSLNPDWQYKFYSQVDRRRLVKDHFGARVLNAFDKLPNTTTSADLFRVCCLYVHGGAYCDIKSSCGSLSWIVHRAQGRLVYFRWPYHRSVFDHPDHAATSFLIWPRRHWVLSNVIDEMVRRIDNCHPYVIKKFVTHVTGPNVYSEVVCAHVPRTHMLYTDNYFDSTFQHDGTKGKYYEYMKSSKLHWSQA